MYPIKALQRTFLVAYDNNKEVLVQKGLHLGKHPEILNTIWKLCKKDVCPMSEDCSRPGNSICLIPPKEIEKQARFLYNQMYNMSRYILPASLFKEYNNKNRSKATRKGRNAQMNLLPAKEDTTKQIDKEYLLSLKQWKITPHGIYFKGSEEDQITRTPIKISKKIKNIDTNYESVTLRWISDDQEKEQIVPMEAISIQSKVAQLCNLGISVNSFNSKSLIKFFDDFLKEIPVPVVLETTSCGWKGNGFVFGNSLYRKGESPHPIIFPDSPFTSKGSYEEWLNAVSPYLSQDKQIWVAMCAATAAFCINLLGGTQNFWVDFFCSTSQGKTFLLELTASLFGSPQLLVRQWNGTLSGHELWFSLCHDCPSFLDESQKVDKRIAEKTIYMFANGSGKTRAESKKGSVSLATRHRFTGIALSAGEHPLTRTSTLGGIAARILSVQRKAPHLNSRDIEKTRRTIKLNYGHIARNVLEYILNRIEDIHRHYEDAQRALDRISVEANTDSRLLEYWALILTGNEILRHAIPDLKSYSFEIEKGCIPEDLIYDSLEQTRSQNPSIVVWDTLKSIVTANISRFYRAQGHGLKDIPPQSKEHWGKIFDSGTVGLYPHIFKRFIGDKGGEEILKRELVAENKLKYKETYPMRIGGKIVKVLIFLDLLKENEEKIEEVI